MLISWVVHFWAICWQRLQKNASLKATSQKGADNTIFLVCKAAFLVRVGVLCYPLLNQTHQSATASDPFLKYVTSRAERCFCQKASANLFWWGEFSGVTDDKIKHHLLSSSSQRCFEGCKKPLRFFVKKRYPEEAPLHGCTTWKLTFSRDTR